jgi:hypothetical protein
MFDQVIDPCQVCGTSTAFGSGNFVNRVGYDEGWACAQCIAYECDACDQKIELDTDVSDEFEFGRYHTWCRDPEKWDECSREWYVGLSTDEQRALVTPPVAVSN